MISTLDKRENDENFKSSSMFEEKEGNENKSTDFLSTENQFSLIDISS